MICNTVALILLPLQHESYNSCYPTQQDCNHDFCMKCKQHNIFVHRMFLHVRHDHVLTCTAVSEVFWFHLCPHLPCTENTKHRRKKKTQMTNLKCEMSRSIVSTCTVRSDREQWLIRTCGAPFCGVLFSHRVPAQAEHRTFLLEHFCCYMSVLLGREPAGIRVSIRP